MDRNIIWTAGDMEGFKDTFRQPLPSSEFHVKEGKIEGWPSYHSSQADPDGGYEAHVYKIHFIIKEPVDAVLYIQYIASTPGIPDLLIDVNGHKGYYYPYPVPSDAKEIKPADALHAAIYSKEEIKIVLPAGLFRRGENIIAITADDSYDCLKIHGEQAILRLDRMADACGFHYGALQLEKLEDDYRNKIRNEAVTVRPGFIYTMEKESLVETCSLFVHQTDQLPRTGLNDQHGGSGTLHLSWNESSLAIPVTYKGGAFGQAKVNFSLPDGTGEVSYRLTGEIEAEGRFHRMRKWKVYTMPHAHTDIGYTHRQWEVAERMCRNMDQAVELLKAHENDFSYIIDGTWHLEAYQQTRSRKRIKEMNHLIKAGKIGIPWNYADLLTQFPTLEALIHNGDFSVRYMKQLGLKPDRADIVDVASATGSYPAVLSGCGVKYLIHANNQDRGPFRFNGGLHRKSPFWWQAKDGSRVMVWLAKMYCELKKVCGSPLSVDVARRGLTMWLQEYEREDYPADAVMLYGMEADNTDIDIRAPGFYREWKENIVYPRLIPSDGSSFFAYMEQWSDQLWSFTGDEGAYWEDGMASSAAESFAVRQAESGLIAAEKLDSLAVLHGPGCRFAVEAYEEAWKEVLLYDEHTWGAFLSGSDPDAMLQKDQWDCKKHMADQAVAWMKRLQLQAVSKLMLMWNNKGREIVVFNPHSFSISDVVTVEIGVHERPADMRGHSVLYETVSQTKTQKVIRMYVDQLEGFAYKRWQLTAIPEPDCTLEKCKSDSNDRHGRWYLIDSNQRIILENIWYIVEINLLNGSIVEIVDKILGKQLIDWRKGEAGRLIYTRGGEDTTLMGNKSGLKTDGAAVNPIFIGRRWRQMETDLGRRIEIEGDTLIGPWMITFELPVYSKEIRLFYTGEKRAVYEPEALYIEFPLKAEKNKQVLSDSQIGWVDWQKDCLPGACREWLPLQTSVLLKEPGMDVQIVSPDAFLFTAGQPVKGQWLSDIKLDGSHIYSYVLNNYWRVNYKGCQEGRLEFRYVITSDSVIPFAQAYQRGWKERQGLVAARAGYQEFRRNETEVFETDSCVLLEWHSSHIVASTIRGTENEDELLIRAMETGGYEGSTSLCIPHCQIMKAWETDLHGDAIEEIPVNNDGSLTISIKSWQVRTVKLRWKRR